MKTDNIAIAIRKGDDKLKAKLNKALDAILADGTYQKINDPDKLAAYAALAGPAITAGGGTFIVRGMPVKTYEAGVNERTVVIEFDSIETAIATHDSPGYAAALAALDDGAVREIRILDGV